MRIRVLHISLMTDSDLDTFLALLAEFDTAMLVTRRKGELRSRPMAIADTSPDGRIRFITRDDSGKLDELENDNRVNVSMQGKSTFLSVSGIARLSRDASIVAEAWQWKQGLWFGDGQEDPHVVVLEVIPTDAEFWDRSRVGLVSLVLVRARQLLSDNAPLTTDAVGQHGNVDFRGKPL